MYLFTPGRVGNSVEHPEFRTLLRLATLCCLIQQKWDELQGLTHVSVSMGATSCPTRCQLAGDVQAGSEAAGAVPVLERARGVQQARLPSAACTLCTVHSA